MNSNPSQRAYPFKLAAWSWFLLAILVTWLVSPALFQLRGLNFEFEFRLGFLLLVCLVWWRINGAVLLIACQAYLFVVEPSGRVNLIQYCWLPLLLLILLVAVERQKFTRQLARLELQQAPTASRRIAWWKFWMWIPPTLKKAATQVRGQWQAIDFRDALRAMLRDWAWLFVVALVCTMMGWLLLWLIPLDNLSRQKIRLLPTGYRAISLTILLGLFALGTTTLVAGLSWRRLSSSQARVYLRESLARWLEPDLKGFVLKRRKSSQKRARRAAN